MQVDAFAARLRGYEELAVLLEKLNGSQALIHVHRAIDHVDLVIAIALGKLLNDIGLRAAVFGTHQHPLLTFRCRMDGSTLPRKAAILSSYSAAERKRVVEG